MDIVYLEEIAKEDKKILLVNVSRTYDDCHQKLANCVMLGNWRINIDRANKVDYIIGVCKGKIVDVIAVKEAKQLISNFEEDNFPCCDLQDCHRYQEKIYLTKAKENFPISIDEKEYQKLNGRVYFIEDKNVTVKTMKEEYVGKQLLTNNGKKFSNYVRYVNV